MARVPESRGSIIGSVDWAAGVSLMDSMRDAGLEVMRNPPGCALKVPIGLCSGQQNKTMVSVGLWDPQENNRCLDVSFKQLF